MTSGEAFEQFQNWYENCLSSGIDPAEVVSQVGEMALITDIALIERLQNAGDI